MGFSTLPDFPTPQRAAPAARFKKTGPALPPRATSLLLALGLLAVFAPAGAKLYDAWATITLTERPVRLPFSVVQQRYGKVWLSFGREGVEWLLGPPTHRQVADPEVLEWGKRAEEFWHKYGMPDDRVWDKWTAPEDEGKWVAVLYAGGIVYYKVKNGF